MPVIETLTAIATATVGAIITAIPIVTAILWNTFISLINGFLDLVNRLGFIAYWTIITTILFVDIGTNFAGQVITFFSSIFFGLTVTSTILFAMSLFGGLIWFLWHSKTGLQYIGRPTR